MICKARECYYGAMFLGFFGCFVMRRNAQLLQWIVPATGGYGCHHLRIIPNLPANQSSNKHNSEWLAMLVTVTLTMLYVLTVWASLPPPKRVMRCPEFGGELTCIGFAPSTTRRLAEFESR